MIRSTTRGISVTAPRLLASLCPTRLPVVVVTMILCYLVPSLLLWKYATRIGSYQDVQTPNNLAAALSAQRIFWKYLGIVATLLAVYTVRRISQVQLIYRAILTDDDLTAGAESEDVRLFLREEIPWDDLAFPTVRWALDHHHASRDRDVFPPFANPPGDPGQAEFEE